MAKNKKNKKLVTNFYWLFIFVFLSFTLISVCSSYKTYLDLKDNEELINEQILKANQEQVLLKSELELYKSDSYVEKTAREKLGYIKPNEKVFINRSK